MLKLLAFIPCPVSLRVLRVLRGFYIWAGSGRKANIDTEWRFVNEPNPKNRHRRTGAHRLAISLSASPRIRPI